MSDKNDLIKIIDSVRSELKVMLESIDPVLEIYPGWTIKEVVGHITAWEIVINKALIAFQAGDPPYFLREQDFDLFNKGEVEKRSGWTLDEVIHEWEEVREELKKTITKLNENDLSTEMVLPWGSERTVEELIEIIAEHEQEHAEDVERVTG
jgi:2-hydroxy-3-keto-5-methylthiopentenyl-1-phosphate phosphatase